MTNSKKMFAISFFGNGLFLLFFCLLAQDAFAQGPHKEITALKIEEKIKIDAVLSEPAWQRAEVGSDFVQKDPKPGEVADKDTKFQILYNNEGIYVGAFMAEDGQENILAEMTERDQLGNTDYFGIVIDAYQDGINGLGFLVTPTNIQFDTKYFQDGEDEGWDAVWDSETRVTDEGWYIEFFIPYSALRFPEKSEQEWNINIVRQIRRIREQSWWNEFNPEIDGFFTQAGVLKGIKGIKPPFRLQLLPYLSSYYDWQVDDNSSPRFQSVESVNGGMDIKYGINDAFTLDMTLIPDFGQVQFDNEVLNLSPFEVQYDENRPFFTEGVELFNKGNLFYSRRIGGQPIGYWNVYDNLGNNDSLISNPSTTPLINATKVSGRTKNGLGIGVINAVTNRTQAEVVDTETGEQRSIETAGLQNYNVMVFDQNLANNSSFTLVNTNVMREGSWYDANVTGAILSLKNEERSYQFFGSYKLSQQFFQDSLQLGHASYFELNKINGNWRWGLSYGEESENYDPNDLGFLYNPNERSVDAFVRFNQFEPKSFYNRFSIGMSGGYNMLDVPSVYTNSWFNINGNLFTKDFFAMGLWTYTEPNGGFDYFEPRTADLSRYFRYPWFVNSGGWISTDYRKRFALDMRFRYQVFGEKIRRNYAIQISPRFRLNDRMLFILNSDYTKNGGETGWVETAAENIYFGRRDRHTVVNTFNTRYIFSENMALTFRARHYWAKVNYTDYHLLEKDGSLGTTNYTADRDGVFNAFTVDCQLRWRFAPGSDAFIVWKNNITDYNQDETTVDYFSNFSLFKNAPIVNSLSLRVVYFLDYATMFKKA